MCVCVCVTRAGGMLGASAIIGYAEPEGSMNVAQVCITFARPHPSLEHSSIPMSLKGGDAWDVRAHFPSSCCVVLLNFFYLPITCGSKISQ